MARMIFVNLAVKDLGRTMELFSKLGFEFNRKFTDDKAACMVINQDASAGGKHAHKPQDHGFMHGWSFYDLDGHHWEVLWMDPKVAQS